MAKVTAPLLSFGASGAIAKAQVYATWRGVQYARRYVVPANPRTTQQMLTRDLWRTLSTMWVISHPDLQAPWNLLALGRQFTGQNRFMGNNTRLIRAEDDMSNFQASPGVRSGFPLLLHAATTGSGSGEIDVTVSVPDPPPDWAIVSVVHVAFPDQDPTDPFAGPITVNSNDSAPYGHTFEDLIPDETYIVSSFIKWLKPDGGDAYGASLTDTADAGS